MVNSVAQHDVSNQSSQQQKDDPFRKPKLQIAQNFLQPYKGKAFLKEQNPELESV